jgi:hypothetical protein
MSAMWTMPFVPAVASRLLHYTAKWLLRIRLQRLFWRFHRLLWGYTYWEGVRGMVPFWCDWKSIAGVTSTGRIPKDRTAGRLKEQVR